MDVVQRWSERIALRVAPEEADFAAEVGTAYAAGGQARKDLQPRSGVQPGAFGPGAFAADLPLILRGLADSASMLLALLRSPYFSNALAAGSLLLAFRDDRRHKRAASARPGAPAAAESAPGPAPQTGQQPAPPASERQALESAFASLRDRLAAAGFEQAQPASSATNCSRNC